MPFPGGQKQITAAFLNIRRRKGAKAAKRFYRKQQREGYAPIARDDQRKRRHRKHALRRAAKGG